MANEVGGDLLGDLIWRHQANGGKALPIADHGQAADIHHSQAHATESVLSYADEWQA